MKLKENSTNQKLRGAYYTPKGLASAIVSLCSIPDNAKILEPSCGDGVFIEALNEARMLNSGIILDAVEIDSVALESARCLDMGMADCNFKNCDFFDFYEKSPKGIYNLILGNPPYIRYQYLNAKQRSELSELLESQGMRSNKLINAWVGFMVACTNLLRKDGTLAFVIPAELLQVAYAKDLRRYLANHFEKITLLSFSNLVFDDIEQETVVFIGQKGENKCQIRIIESTDVAELSARNLDTIEYQPIMPTEEKWTRYFISNNDSRVLNRLSKDTRLVPFSELALINVGVTTGNNSYFSLTDNVADTYNLTEYTIPLIGRSSHASGVYFTAEDWTNNRLAGKKARLLTLSDGSYSMLDSKQRQYIDEGALSGAGKGYKCSIRESWYSVPSIWIPDAFFLRRNNLYPKFVINSCSAISTDTMHRMKLREDLDARIALICYYNSISFAYTELCGRSYGGGVLEILPNEVGAVLVLNPDYITLPEDIINSAVTLIDDTIRGNNDIEIALDHIDKNILQDAFGFDSETCAACRRIWKTLQARRLGRGAKR